MPVSMRFPIKIRIDRNAMDDRAECLDAALRAAVGRAFANSQKLLDLRGGYVDVCFHDPSFSWQGLAVDEQDRMSLEKRIADLLRGLASRQDIASPTRSVEVPEVLPMDPSEPYDDMRGFRLPGVYLIDSYDGNQEAVPV